MPLGPRDLYAIRKVETRSILGKHRIQLSKIVVRCTMIHGAPNIMMIAVQQQGLVAAFSFSSVHFSNVPS